MSPSESFQDALAFHCFLAFRFHCADLANSAYNPAGQTRSRDYKFSFPGNSYDFVFLTSVFTHMLKLDVKNYLAEISRVMSRRGPLDAEAPEIRAGHLCWEP